MNQDRPIPSIGDCLGMWKEVDFALQEGEWPETAAIPQKLDDLNFYRSDLFEWSSPFVLGGFLAWSLFSGGAYERHAAGAVDAKRLGDGAAGEMVCDDYESTPVFMANVAWSDFFMDVAWDSTWVVIDAKRRLVHVILATDTD